MKSEEKRRPFTKCPTIWINLTSQFQSIRGGQVRVGRGHCEDEGVWIGNEGQDHLLYLCLNVLWLVTNRNLRQQQWAFSSVTVSTQHRCGAAVNLWWLQTWWWWWWYHYLMPLCLFAHMKQNPHPCRVAEFTLVMPGKSTKVRLRTLGEKIFKYMGSGLIP